MAGTALTFDVTDAVAMLTVAAARADDMTPAMEGVGEVIVTQISRAFEDGQSPGGQPWLPSFRARTEGGQTLVDNAILKNSMNREAGPRSVVVGTNVVYAAIHHFGGTIHAKGGGKLKFKIGEKGPWAQVDSVTIPARPFMPEEADLEWAEIYATILDHLGMQA